MATALIQRVTSAHVDVDNTCVGKIDQGILLLLGIDKTDDKKSLDRMLDRILSYRIFQDDNDKMNLSVTDIQGGLLIVPQFTLAADTKSGTRPGFSTATEPSEAKRLFIHFVEQAKSKYHHIATGQFGADMQVHLINDGPVTFIL